MCSWELLYTIGVVISNEECKKRFKTRNIFQTELCMLPPKNQSPSAGDSGGPLILKYSNSVQIGIQSLISSKGAEKGFPVVFTRLSYYVSWIQIITQSPIFWNSV